jgi:hypothetical protein
VVVLSLRKGLRGCIAVGSTTLCAITKVVSSNPFHGKVYSIQHYMIKFVSDLQQVGGFLQALWHSSINKTDCHDIIEILLNVALNTITLLPLSLR